MVRTEAALEVVCTEAALEVLRTEAALEVVRTRDLLRLECAGSDKPGLDDATAW